VEKWVLRNPVLVKGIQKEVVPRNDTAEEPD